MPIVWRNGEIVVLNDAELPFDTEFDDSSISFSVKVVCYASQPVFPDDFIAEVSGKLNAIGATYSSDNLMDAIRKLHIRNRAYMWTVCHVLFRIDGENNSLYLLVEPIETAFSKEQVIWQMCILNSLSKPVGISPAVSLFFDNVALKMSLREIRIRGCHDGVIVGNRNQIIESYRGNIFAVKKQTVLTPSLDCGCRVVAGRQWVIDSLRSMDFVVMETNHFYMQSLYDAEEVFVVATDGMYHVKGLDSSRFYDTVRPKLIDKMAEMISNK